MPAGLVSVFRCLSGIWQPLDSSQPCSQEIDAPIIAALVAVLD